MNADSLYSEFQILCVAFSYNASVCSENKGTDWLSGHHPADLHL